jgi:adenylylsulfate kinase
LPASGKSTLAAALQRQLREHDINVVVLESDALRKIFSEQPRYDEQEREYFYRSLAFIGRTLTEHGISVIFDATANRRSYRDRARQLIPRFAEVLVDCPLDICMRRDPKGIYSMAREGKAAHVPGVQTAYEPPENPALVVRGDREDPEVAARRVMEVLASKKFICL